MLCPLRRLLFAASPGRRLLTRPCALTVPTRRPLHCSRCRLRQDAPQEVTPPSLEDELDKGFTSQQKEAILRLFNTASQSQLESLHELQGGMAACIVQHRQQHGPFLHIDGLRHVQEFQPASILRACDSILNITARTQRQTIARFIKPDTPLHRLQAAESVVSIVFGLKKLAWVHMERSMAVRDWQQRECFHFMKGRHLPEIYLEDVSSVVSQLPQADFYILEKPAVSNQKSALFPVALHLRTVEAMLYSMLNPRFQVEREHRVLSMARNTVGKHFEIMLGESRTSGVDVVQRLIDEAVIVPKPRVTFMPELIQRYRHHFQARGQNRNEEMCDALLQAVTFYELALS